MHENTTVLLPSINTRPWMWLWMRASTWLSTSRPGAHVVLAAPRMGDPNDVLFNDRPFVQRRANELHAPLIR